MKNFKIIKKYFQVTKANKKITLLLIIASLLTNGPYMFTSLLFSLSINYLAKELNLSIKSNSLNALVGDSIMVS